MSNLVDRDAALVALSKDHAKQPNGCWEWTRSTGSAGYGQIYGGFQRVEGAHRAAYMVWVGEIGPGLMVCHRCDNRICINPEHLFLGTAFDNTQDMIRKGRLRPRRRRDECPRGHAYDGRTAFGTRICKVCMKAARKRFEDKRKARAQ